MSTEKKIIFIGKHMAGKTWILPASKEAEALRTLMGRNIETYELNLLSKIGLTVEIKGDIEDEELGI